MAAMYETKTSLTTARLRALNAVLDEGSYSAAARRLGMTQPAISQAVQDLEKAFSVKLFERRGRMLVPSELCLDLAPLAEEIMRLEKAALILMKKNEQLKTGILRVGLGSLMPGMALINAFQRRFPGIQVQVEYKIYSEIIDSILEHRTDVGILPNVPEDGRFYRETCLSQDVVALIPLGHPLALSERISIVDLVGEKLIFQRKGSATQKVVDSALKKARMELRASLVLETGVEVYEAVVNGLGIGFMWRHGTSRKDGVRRIPVTEIRSIYDEFVFRRSDLQNPAVDMFFATIDHFHL